MRKYILSFLIAALFLIPTKSKAIGLGFGGYVNVVLPCTCSGNFWVYMTPLFLSSVPISGAMVWQPGGTIPYANFVIPQVPTTWLLGDYVPGAGICLMYAGVTCVPIPAVGMINQVGSSFPGGTVGN